MATIRALCTRSLGLIGAYGVGEAVSAEDADIALDAALSAFKKLSEYGAGRKFATCSQDEDVTAANDMRYVAEANIVITLPLNPDDADKVAIIPRAHTVTVKGNSRDIDGSQDNYQPNQPRTLIYVGDKGNWVVIDDLTLNDEPPFSEVYEEDLVYIICAAINEHFRQDMPSNVTRMIVQARARFRAAFSRAKTSSGDLPNSVRGAQFVRRYA